MMHTLELHKLATKIVFLIHPIYSVIKLFYDLELKILHQIAKTSFSSQFTILYITLAKRRAFQATTKDSLSSNDFTVFFLPNENKGNSRN